VERGQMSFSLLVFKKRGIILVKLCLRKYNQEISFTPESDLYEILTLIVIGLDFGVPWEEVSVFSMCIANLQNGPGVLTS
jgi:hypothetical protein